jgi:hypothetical protein
VIVVRPTLPLDIPPTIPRKANGNGNVNGSAARTAQKRKAFIGALAKTGTVTHAAKAAKIGRRTAYQWRDADEVFAAEWDEALEFVADEIEDALRTLALKCYDDNPPKSATTAAIFLLKGMRPNKYRERHHINANVTVNVVDFFRKAAVERADPILARN